MYTVNKLARLAGISVRTLHYYDEMGLLKPKSSSVSGYRQYAKDAVERLQQILFFRELDFYLDETRTILSSPDFNTLEALHSHRVLLKKRAERIYELISTIDKTISKMEGKRKMEIKEYYQGFSDAQVEKYRREVRRRWGKDVLNTNEARVLAMVKEKFVALQAEGSAIFTAISDNIIRGFDSPAVQTQIAAWRQWLENFHHYSGQAVPGLGQAYSQHSEFTALFREIHPDLPEFLTRAIEYY